MIVHARTRAGHAVTLNLQPGSLTAAFDQQTVLAYDRAGRLWSAFFHGHTFRRGLDGGMLGKWTERGQRQRKRLSPAETSLVVDCAAVWMRGLHAATLDAAPEAAPTVRALAERAARFTAQAARADVERFLRLYRPIGILPPDQYLALVLQMTEGCSFNTCTFCSFYRDRPFRIKAPDEFRAHIEAVRSYMGESLALRRGIFLADANALVVPQRQLVALLAVLRAEQTRLATLSHSQVRERPVGAFLDGFSGRKKSAEEYAELARYGLRRVYLGLESGHDPLLVWLRKPGRAADVLEAARAIRAGGVRVCVMVLLGAGGTRFAAGHVRDTVAAINALELGAADLIYFSEFVAAPAQPYGQIAARDKIEPLTAAQARAQRSEIEAGLRFPGLPPRVSTYDIREFIY
jgi:hypothetical protein